MDLRTASTIGLPFRSDPIVVLAGAGVEPTTAVVVVVLLLLAMLVVAAASVDELMGTESDGGVVARSLVLESSLGTLMGAVMRRREAAADDVTADVTAEVTSSALLLGMLTAPAVSSDVDDDASGDVAVTLRVFRPLAASGVWVDWRVVEVSAAVLVLFERPTLATE